MKVPHPSCLTSGGGQRKGGLLSQVPICPLRDLAFSRHVTGCPWVAPHCSSLALPLPPEVEKSHKSNPARQAMATRAASYTSAPGPATGTWIQGFLS